MAEIESNVTVESHKSEVEAEFKKAVERALVAVGLTAQGYATLDCPTDTGRLKNSITFVTSISQGPANQFPGASAKPEDYSPLSKPEPGVIYIGTNVEYAPYVEYDDTKKHINGKAHFLRDAATKHGDEYKKIFEANLSNT